MNRRETWDRTFEKRLAKVKAAHKGVDEVSERLKLERTEEDERRMKWDEGHATTRR